MKKKFLLIAGVLALSQSTGTFAQTSDATGKAGGQGANDPFVQNREAKTQAKKQYKSHEISKDEYKQERKQAASDLRASGQRSDTEKNLEVPNSAGADSSGK